jgi:hypothetical protein
MTQDRESKGEQVLDRLWKELEQSQLTEDRNWIRQAADGRVRLRARDAEGNGLTIVMVDNSWDLIIARRSRRDDGGDEVTLQLPFGSKSAEVAGAEIAEAWVHRLEFTHKNATAIAEHHGVRLHEIEPVGGGGG